MTEATACAVAGRPPVALVTRAAEPAALRMDDELAVIVEAEAEAECVEDERVVVWVAEDVEWEYEATTDDALVRSTREPPSEAGVACTRGGAGGTGEGWHQGAITGNLPPNEPS
jgi:hypothetical protein